MSGLHLFEGFGVEIEYMIVAREDLAVLPVTDQVLAAVAGEVVNEVEVGPLRWSNELVLHVIELKTNGPAPRLGGLARTFGEHVQRVNRLLEPLGGCLLPSAMHPWMDPERDTRLWPHDNSVIYQSYNRIFGCRGHGWSNLQSLHLNLPFSGDDEFGRLHAAIRVVLPILPALAASSPIVEGRPTGMLDTRLDMYRHNQARIPSIAGAVIPEPVFTKQAYADEILGRIYRDIAPHDPEGILQDEWLNSRGAIARFERDAIEIRVIDVQECPAADLAVAEATVAALRALVAEGTAPLGLQQRQPVDRLGTIFGACVRDGDQARIADAEYLKLFGLDAPEATAGELWRHIVAAELPAGSRDPEVEAALETILDQGPLSRRLLRTLGDAPSRDALAGTYRELCGCVAENRPYRG